MRAWAKSAVAGFGLLLVFSAFADRVEATASIGACCRPNQGCETIDSFSCEEAGGIYFGDDTSCAGIVCDQQVAAPALSLLGLIGTFGALLGVATFRLLRSPRSAAAGKTGTT